MMGDWRPRSVYRNDLVAETKTPAQALEYAIRRKKSLENQLLIQKQGLVIISQMTTIKTEPVGFIQRKGNINNRYPTRGWRGRQLQQQRGNLQRQSTEQKQQYFKCGNPFGPGHLQQCHARDKICNKCTKRCHYARLSKSSDVNAIEDDQTSWLSLQDTDVAAYVNYLQAGNLIPGWEIVHPDDSTTDSIQFESKPVGRMGEADLKGHLLRVRAGPNNLVFIADTVLLIKKRHILLLRP